MRIGVIGCGHLGSQHVRVLHELTEVTDVVVIDDRPPRLAAMMAEHVGVLPRSSLRSAIDHIDALIVATPPRTHAELAIEAIEAGKHVLVEGPLATSVGDALNLVEAADGAGVNLATGHVSAHDDAVAKLAEFVEAGELGRLHHLSASRLGLGPYHSTMNVLWDLAADDVLVASSLLGAMPDTVAAWGDCHTAGFAEDVASLRLSFADRDITSTIRASWLDPEDVRRITVVGSEKMAISDDADPQARLAIVDRGRRLRVRLGSDEPMALNYRDGEVVVPYVPFRDPLKLQARNFVRSCLAGARPIVDGRAGLGVVAVLDAADRSLAERGAPIPVEVPHPRTRPSLAAA